MERKERIGLSEVRFNNFFNNLASRMPAKVDDLSPTQFEGVANLLFAAEMPDVEKKIRILVCFFNRFLDFRFRFCMSLLNEEQALELCSFTGFLFENSEKI